MGHSKRRMGGRMNTCGISEYELKAWIERLGSEPVERIAYIDIPISYEMSRASVFELKDGKYAIVTESGCSCYDASEANIDLYPKLEQVLEKFNEWIQINKNDFKRVLE